MFNKSIVDSNIIFPTGCALSYYSSGGVDCSMCPSNSVQSSSNPSECSCLDNRVTASGGSTTTSQGCDGKEESTII